MLVPTGILACKKNIGGATTIFHMLHFSQRVDTLCSKQNIFFYAVDKKTKIHILLYASSSSSFSTTPAALSSASASESESESIAGTSPP